MNFGRLMFFIIGIFTVLTVFSSFFLEKKYSISLAMIDLSVIVFAFLVWLNDKYFHERPGQRIFSISDRAFIDDVIARQMNMHGVTEIKEENGWIGFFKKGHKTGEVRFRMDEDGQPVKIDGKYIIEVKAPEYILHNIDHETWNLIGSK